MEESKINSAMVSAMETLLERMEILKQEDCLDETEKELLREGRNAINQVVSSLKSDAAADENTAKEYNMIMLRIEESLRIMQAKVEVFRKEILDKQNALRKRKLESMGNAADGIRRVILNMGNAKFPIEVPLTLDALRLRIDEKFGKQPRGKYHVEANSYIVDSNFALLSVYEMVSEKNEHTIDVHIIPLENENEDIGDSDSSYSEDEEDDDNQEIVKKWRKEEIKALKAAIKKVGRKWKLVSELVKTRTPQACRNYFRKNLADQPRQSKRQNIMENLSVGMKKISEKL
jgi:hypothetical protein